MAFTEFETDSNKLLLDSVNVLLQTIGEIPIEEEDGIESIIEARIAATVLIETKKEVLSEGWDFNTDDNYSLMPDTNGRIAIPFNVLDLYSDDNDLIIRENELYSKSNNSSKFDEAKSANIIWDVAFNTLSHPIRNYITIKASRKFQARTIMDSNVYGYTQEDEDDAGLIARRSEGRTAGYNMLTSGLYSTNVGIL